VKGFAVTLMAGLVANLITAVFVSRMIFDWHLQDRPKTAALSI
jgi:preprotein translocase subunit SecD